MVTNATKKSKYAVETKDEVKRGRAKKNTAEVIEETSKDNDQPTQYDK